MTGAPRVTSTIDEIFALPIVAAPMAGGATTVALSASVAAVGGFPFLAGGYRAADALRSQITELQGLTRAFGVNLFVPSTVRVDPAVFAAYATAIESEAAVHRVTLDTMPRHDDDEWQEKLALLVENPVPVVSLTFGLPEVTEIRLLQSVGTLVWATVTTPEEAVQAATAGVDAIVVQGADAGGHSAVFDPASRTLPLSTADLVRRVRRRVALPVVAAGGVDGPEAVRDLLAAGARAVAVGTMLLRTDEAGTSPTHRRALADPRFTETELTRVFTGRPARALLNGFVERHRAEAITGYPAVHHLTAGLRRAASAADDLDRVHLWAGTGWRSAPTGPAGDVVRWLAGG